MKTLQTVCSDAEVLIDVMTSLGMLLLHYAEWVDYQGMCKLNNLLTEFSMHSSVELVAQADMLGSIVSHVMQSEKNN